MRREVNPETWVIGAVMMGEDTGKNIDYLLSRHVTEDDFAEDAARTAFNAIISTRSTDPGVVTAQFTESRYTDWLLETMMLSSNDKNLPLYVDTLKEASRKRKLKRIADNIYSAELTGEPSSDTYAAVKGLLETFEPPSVKSADSTESMRRWWKYHETIKNDPGAAYCSTGYKSLDHYLGGGMFNDEVYILAGRPGMGKTTQGIGIAERVAKSGKAVLFCSIEMSETQITSKRLAIAGGLDYTRLMNGQTSDEDMKELAALTVELSNHPFFTVDDVNTVSQIEERTRGVENLGLVVIDYLGLIQTGERVMPRYEEVTRISADIKALAKKLHRPILLLAQLNRENTTRSNKRPTMADLRDSGAIEQDAGAVILLHRDSYYEPEEEPPETEEIELIIAKNRHAAPGTVKMMWHGASGQITEVERNYPL